MTAAPENRGRSGSERDPGGRFRKGRSGNAAGRPKGSGAYAVRKMWAEALADPETRRQAIERLRAAVKSQKTVVAALESAARINREIGSGSENQLPGVTINITTNIDPERLRVKRPR